MQLLNAAFTLSLGLSVAVTIARAADFSYGDAERIWHESKARPDYKRYQEEFVQYSNYLHLDTRNSCYQISRARVHLSLIVSSKGIVEAVVSDVGDGKAACFRGIYLGLRVKEPPFAPLIISLNFE